MRAIRLDESDYPQSLTQLDRPPDPLYTIGNESLLELAPNRLVAIVGTREASSYGVRITAALAEAFAEAGIGVVSGLARGIDAAAHRAALDAGGKTIAVMGTGVDIPYPVGHRALHSEIAQRGLIVSENEPGMSAMPGCFPRRNRIIAALARVTIVVEAPFKSGAVNTATHALDQGRVVAAVPGPIDSPRSAGSNLLIRDGAVMLNSVNDALMLYGLTQGKKGEGPTLTNLESIIWEALADGSAPVEALVSRAGLTIRQTLEGIARLELNGMVRQHQNGSIERIRIA